jgi:hypothetical protein
MAFTSRSPRLDVSAKQRGVAPRPVNNVPKLKKQSGLQLEKRAFWARDGCDLCLGPAWGMREAIGASRRCRMERRQDNLLLLLLLHGLLHG